MKSGVSSRPWRIHRPRNTRPALSTKGTRQPQDRKSSSGSIAIRLTAMVASSMPRVTPTCGTLPNRPLRLAGAYS
ncbi:hypothetical protein D3C75_1155350 [compost metagenome]